MRLLLGIAGTALAGHSLALADETLRWAVLGTGQAAQLTAPHLDAVAVGTRDPESQRVREFARAFAPNAAVGSYAAAVEDPRVQAVYVALPSALKEEWALRAVRLGRHVLLEKPPGVDAASARRIADACAERQVVCMDGTAWLHHPRAAALGRLRTRAVAASGHFAITGPAPGDIRMEPRLEPAGVAGDLCWYAVSWVLWVFGEMPRHFRSRLVRGAGNAPVRAEAEALFSEGRSAEVSCSFGAPEEQHASLESAASSAHFSSFFDGAWQEERGGVLRQEHAEGDAVTAMVARFHGRVRDGQPGLPRSSLEAMEFLDAMLRPEGPDSLPPPPKPGPSRGVPPSATGLLAEQGFVRLQGWLHGSMGLVEQMRDAALDLAALNEHRWQNMFSARSQFTWTRCAGCRHFLLHARLGGLASALLGAERMRLVEDAVLDLTEGWPGLHWHVDTEPNTEAVFGSLVPGTRGVSLWIPLLVNRTLGGELALAAADGKCGARFAAYPEDEDRVCYEQLERSKVLPDFEVGDVFAMDSGVWHRTEAIVGRRLVYFVRFAAADALLLHRHQAMPHCLDCGAGTLQDRCFPTVWPESSWPQDVFDARALRDCRRGELPNCWSGLYTPELCCADPPVGNPICWTQEFTYETCCRGAAGAAGTWWAEDEAARRCCALASRLPPAALERPLSVPTDVLGLLGQLLRKEAGESADCAELAMRGAMRELAAAIEGRLDMPACLPSWLAELAWKLAHGSISGAAGAADAASVASASGEAAVAGETAVAGTADEAGVADEPRVAGTARAASVSMTPDTTGMTAGMVGDAAAPTAPGALWPTATGQESAPEADLCARLADGQVPCFTAGFTRSDCCPGQDLAGEVFPLRANHTAWQSTRCYDGEIFTTAECCSAGWARLTTSREDASPQADWELRHLAATVRDEEVFWDTPVTVMHFKQDSREWLYKELREDNQYNLPWLRQALPDAPVVVDVGCSIGLVAVLLAKWRPNATIVCIEESITLHRYTLWNLRVNGVQGNVRAVHAAVGLQDGGHTSSAWVQGPVAAPGACADTEYFRFNSGGFHTYMGYTPFVTLSAILEREGLQAVPLDLFKIDCEGCEYFTDLPEAAAIVAGEIHEPPAGLPASEQDRVFRVLCGSEGGLVTGCDAAHAALAAGAGKQLRGAAGLNAASEALAALTAGSVVDATQRAVVATSGVPQASEEEGRATDGGAADIVVGSMFLGAQYYEAMQPARENHRRYCQRHGYRYELVSYAKDGADSRTKARFILRMFREGASHVFWMDADSLFVNQERSLGELLGLGRDLAFCGDGNLVLNSGHLLIRNSAWSRWLLEAASDPGLYAEPTAAGLAPLDDWTGAHLPLPGAEGRFACASALRGDQCGLALLLGGAALAEPERWFDVFRSLRRPTLTPQDAEAAQAALPPEIAAHVAVLPQRAMNSYLPPYLGRPDDIVAACRSEDLLLHVVAVRDIGVLFPFLDFLARAIRAKRFRPYARYEIGEHFLSRGLNVSQQRWNALLA